MNFTEAIAQFDPASVADRLSAAETERKQILDLFPLNDWPTLPLSRYALGQGSDGVDMTYCRLLEFASGDLGSISGGSALKHMIYLHRSGEWKLTPELRGLPVEQAWERLRGEFVAAFDAVSGEDFAALDELTVLRSGQALTTKSLATYFPQHFLPIYSASHLRAFIGALGGTPERDAPAWRLNRQLHRLVAEKPPLSQWKSLEVMSFLYRYFDPRSAERVAWKIAPGPGAAFWPECLDEQMICVEWDEVGDLSQYTSDTELKRALDMFWPESEGGNLHKARNLLAFRDLEAGDRIVANRGMTHILAIGTVTGGYRFDETRPKAQHTIPVEWDTSYQQDLPKPERGWRPTFARVSPKRLAEFMRGALPAQERGTNREVPEDVSSVLKGLDRKKQVVLHGPPGTGKTRMALNAALALVGHAAAIDTPESPRKIDDMLSEGRVRMVTFHPSYGYEDFVEGYKPLPDAADSGLRLALTDGLFYDICSEASKTDQPYLLIIDEINRGDLPRIFGELVTLLESDKRGIKLELPISKRDFTVPPNVRIIATMNTADRSVGHLDAAIRRRFGFIYLGPDPEALPGSVGPLDLARLLESLNSRISQFLDTDHQIGHAYLMRDSEPVATDEELAAAFYHDIVPLLEDYCVGRTELLRQILGRLIDPESGRPVLVADADLASELAGEFTAAVVSDADE
ncbi:McrB family protein [Nocardia nova]|uniref:McrB family protein n=1 Tax=Nocardia nova TaxID=37330 RepID=UPI0027391EE8|nr:AAA family ATPase [Nocardia nova]